MATSPPASGTGTQAPTSPEGWRIDDLAQRAGITVDTIRYYQREGLLPPGERCGRTNLYGPHHLEQLERIKHLQSRRFSLAAIRALLADDRGGFEGLFSESGGGSYSLEELVERSGIEPGLAAALRASGLLRDPGEFGRDAYDAEDLGLLRTMAELERLDLPEKALVEIGRIYAAGIEATQREIVDLFTTGGTVPWTDEELAAFQQLAARTVTEILPRARRLVEYAHNRTIQRLALDAIDRGTLPEPDEQAPRE